MSTRCWPRRNEGPFTRAEVNSSLTQPEDVVDDKQFGVQGGNDKKRDGSVVGPVLEGRFSIHPENRLVPKPCRRKLL
jgi:hypothetical protein